MATEYLDQLRPGWFVLEVMKRKLRGREWTALMIDVDPEVYPTLPEGNAKSAWFDIPGEYRDRESAWDALDDLMTTKH